MRLASVILDIPTQALDTPYTYLVPEDAQAEAAELPVLVGCAVLVPFGHRQAVGFVVALEEAGADNPLAEKYPLVYLQEHARFRVHIQWWETPLLRELDPEPLAKVNGADAEARGVSNGDIVEVFNDRGHAVL